MGGALSIKKQANKGFSEGNASLNSILEAAAKEQRLREFYREQGWALAPMALDYIRLFKPAGSKRKDRITENILHELDPLLVVKAHVQANFLPQRITFYIEDGNEKMLPPAFQSIEHLFTAIAIHDTDEDYPEASPQHFREFMYDKIDLLDCSEEEKSILKFSVEFDVQSLEALTFGRKVFDRDGTSTKIILTHDGDLNTYLLNLQGHWPAIAAKGLDRLGGLVTRYNPYSDNEFFTIKKQENFLKETYRLFMHAQPLENGIERYPEMHRHLTTINAKINVAYRCLSAFVANHPETLKNEEKVEFNPATTKIDIHRHLEKATLDVDVLDRDTLPLVRLVNGLKKEAKEYPSLMRLVLQMEDQIDKVIADHPNKNPDQYITFE